MDKTIKDSDLPALFQSADSASVRYQSIYLVCIALDLILIAAAGLIGAISLEAVEGKFVLAVITAILMALGMILTVLIKMRKFERTWFDGRAVAESVKTTSWRFMMSSEPYDESLDKDQAAALFKTLVTELINESLHSEHLIKIAGNSYDVTPKMQEVRAYDFDKKKALYLEERLKDQKGWYKKKADQNVKSKNKWFYGILAAQGAGLLSTYLLVNCPNFPILLPSVFAAIAAAFVAWLQIKKHQELASTYGLAAKELSTIDAQTYEVDDKTKLAGFVADAENAMSREHAMWVVRRDHI